MVDYLLNEIWGIVGVLVSGIGLYLAFSQIRRLATRTQVIDETYKQTVKDVENRDTISNISMALQKVETIKRKIIENNIDTLLLYELSPLSKLLVLLNRGLRNNTQETNLETFKMACNELEIKIITTDTELTKNDLRNELIILSDLELKLTEIQSNLRYNRNNN